MNRPDRLLTLSGVFLVIVPIISVLIVTLVFSLKLFLIPYLISIVIIGSLLVILGILGHDSRFANVFIILLSILITIGFIESTLVVVRIIKPDTLYLKEMLVDDPILGNRIKPLRDDIDENGWRNLFTKSKVDIAVLGDSQTYGINASVQETWPSQLGSILSQDVYSMALGGYGPLQYEALLDEALIYSPDTILVGFYFGNDIGDSYRHAYDLEFYENRRAPEITDSDHEEFKQVLDEFGFGSITRLYNDLPKPFFSVEYILGLFKTETSIGRLVFGQPSPRGIRMKESRLIDATIDFTEQFPHLVDYYYDDNMFTIFSPSYRHFVQDISLASIRDGQRLALESILHIQDRLVNDNIGLYVILIPTKEYAFRNIVSERTQSNVAYVDLIDAEQMMRMWLTDFLNEQDIQYIDTSPCLELGLSEGEPIYPRILDGHPLAQGYRRIAECVANGLGDLASN